MSPYKRLMVASAVLTALLCSCSFERSEVIRGTDVVGGVDSRFAAPLKLSGQEIHLLLKSAYQSIRQRRGELGMAPARIKSDRRPRIAFLSVAAGTEPAVVVAGQGEGIVGALNDALKKLAVSYPADSKRMWLKLDIVDSVGQPVRLSDKQVLDLPPGLYGLALDEGDHQFAILAEEIVSAGLVDSERRVRLERMARYVQNRRTDRGRLARRLAGGGPVEFKPFRATSFFFDGKQVLKLYRGHRQKPDVKRKSLLDSAKAGGDYLLRSLNKHGMFVYAYLPEIDKEKKAYSLVRHAGTIYAMLELYEVTGDPRLLAGAESALSFLEHFIRPDGSGKYALVVSADRIKLGGVALAVVAMDKYMEVTGSRKHLPIVKKLAGYITKQQNKNGSFVHMRSYPGEKASNSVSEYYPGEAILALVKTYKIDGDSRWLDAARRNARYLIQVRDEDKSTKELQHDHWLLYGLSELYDLREDDLYFQHAMRIARAIEQGQNREPEFPDYLGSYYLPPRSTPTATRTEGLMAAYRLAKKCQQEKLSDEILQTALLNAEFQLCTQFKPESILYVDNPSKCSGGFHRTLTDLEIRIDYVQHNISALLLLSRALAGDEKVIESRKRKQ